MSDSILDSILAAAESLSVSGSTPSSSSGGASSLAGRVAPRQGGDMPEGTVKLFAVLDLDCSDLSFCFGIIGTGSAFCVRRNCRIKAHANFKVSFAGAPESFVFICRNIPGTVFREPKLSSDKVPAEIMSDWVAKTLSISAWTTEFQAIDGTSEILTSAEEFQTETEFLAESTLLRTPAKRKKDSFCGEEYEGLKPSWTKPKYDRTFPEDTADLEALISEGVKKGVVTTTVSKIESYIVGMGEAVQDVTAIHHDRLVSLEDDLEVMIGVVQTLKSRLGTTVDLGEQFTAPTLWGAAAFIADDLTKVTQDLEDMYECAIKPMEETLTLLNTADAEMNAKTKKVIKAVKILLGRVLAVNESIQEVKADLVLVRAEQSVRFTSTSAAVSADQEPADELMEFIMSEEGTPPTPSNSGSNETLP